MFEDLPPRVQRLGATLRDRYGTPRNVCRALGLDAAILNEEPEEEEEEDEMRDNYPDQDDDERDGDEDRENGDVKRRVAEMLMKCAELLSGEGEDEEPDEDAEVEEIEGAAEDEDNEQTELFAGQLRNDRDIKKSDIRAARNLAQDAQIVERFPNALRLRSRDMMLTRNFGQPAQPKPEPASRARIAQDAASRADTLIRFPHANRLRRFG